MKIVRTCLFYNLHSTRNFKIRSGLTDACQFPNDFKRFVRDSRPLALAHERLDCQCSFHGSLRLGREILFYCGRAGGRGGGVDRRERPQRVGAGVGAAPDLRDICDRRAPSLGLLRLRSTP